jgi:hypothetical protein
MVRRQGRALLFARTRRGRALLRYGGLSATDARGAPLSSRLLVNGGMVRLEVNDAHARYPLTVDPLVQEAPKLTASDAAGDSFFGTQVAISSDGSTALIAGQGPVGQLVAWVFTRSGSSWSQQGPKLTAADPFDVSVATSVALSHDGNTALLADGDAAWIFTRTGSVWSATAQLQPNDAVGDPDYGFAAPLSGDGNTAVITGPSDTPAQSGRGQAGAAWVFTRSGATWSQQGPKLTAAHSTDDGFFGDDVALSDDGSTAAIGGESDRSTGALWIFTRASGSWQRADKLTNGDPAFAASVALSDDGETLLLGDVDARQEAGVARVFVRSGSDWTEQGGELIPPDTSPSSFFGTSASLSSDGNIALIGGDGNGTPDGGAWTFVRSGASWRHLGSKFTSSDGVGVTAFGYTVGLSGDGTTALVGGPEDNQGVGAAWAFAIDTTPPSASALVSPAEGAENVAPRPTLTWSPATDTGSGIDHYELWIDGQKNRDVPAGTCAAGLCSTQPVKALGQGSHTWFVKAVDGGGNATSSVTASFSVDATSPTSFSNVAPADGSRLDAPAPTLQWTASSDAGSGLAGYRALVDGVQAGPDLPPTTTSYTLPHSLSDGLHTWQIVAFDHDDNAQAGPKWGLIVDTAAPSAAIAADDGRPLTSASVTFDASASTDPEGAAIVKYEWDPEGTGNFISTDHSPTFSHAYATPGTYRAAVRVTNEVGLTSTATTTVVVYPTPPSGNVGVLINNGDYATDNRHVQIDLVWPAGTNQVLISNDGGFGASGSTETADLAPEIDWTLEQTGQDRLPKTVYVRFLGGPGLLDLLSYTDDIVLDEQAPTVQSARLLGQSTKLHGDATAARARQRRYSIKIKAKDPIVGICEVASSPMRHGGATVAVGNCHHRGTLHLGRVVHFTTTGQPKYVRVRNSAGTWSRWHKLN